MPSDRLPARLRGSAGGYTSIENGLQKALEKLAEIEAMVEVLQASFSEVLEVLLSQAEADS